MQLSIQMGAVSQGILLWFTRKAILTKDNYSHNLPVHVEALFTRQPPIKDIYECVLGPANSYYVGYLDNDNKIYCVNNGLPVHLTKWLSTNAKGFVEHDIRTTTIALGPNGSYVAKDKNKMEWCGVPDALAAHLSKYGAQRTRLVTLGIDGTYVVINTDGSGLRNVSGRFPGLEKHLAGMSSLENIHVGSTFLARPSTEVSESTLKQPNFGLFDRVTNHKE